ncbi:MAG: SoxR reducing system RseC family protein [Thermodesulfovibrionales bacterium]|nr:SoxR reducing system RseC family protein [Thermodesulfovibrionales bacterium]
MQDIGVVKEIKGDKAIVVFETKSACQCCPGASLCNTVGDSQREVEATNEIGAAQGDSVRIRFRSYSFLKGTIIVYLIPTFFLIIGAIIGRNIISPMLPSYDPEAVSALVGFLLFTLTFIVIRILAKRKPSNTPIITEIIR